MADEWVLEPGDCESSPVPEGLKVCETDAEPGVGVADRVVLGLGLQVRLPVLVMLGDNDVVTDVDSVPDTV